MRSFTVNNIHTLYDTPTKKKRYDFLEKAVASSSSTCSLSNSTSRLDSLVDPIWEQIDPTPDIYALFLQYNDMFFNGKLVACEVKWSPRMTSCAGVCSFEGSGGLCSIRLSTPLLKFRPRKDLVETLLHEMIHAYLFLTDRDTDRDGHGPKFQYHMRRINARAGTNITIYHSFYDEVKFYQQHWWRCIGPCRNRPPFFGWVRRAVNRPPGKNDFWWEEHRRMCGGTFVKVKEPEGYGSKKKKPLKEQDGMTQKNQTSLNRFFPGKGHILGRSSSFMGISGGPGASGFKPVEEGSRSNGLQNQKPPQLLEETAKKTGKKKEIAVAAEVPATSGRSSPKSGHRNASSADDLSIVVPCPAFYPYFVLDHVFEIAGYQALLVVATAGVKVDTSKEAVEVGI